MERTVKCERSKRRKNDCHFTYAKPLVQTHTLWSHRWWTKDRPQRFVTPDVRAKVHLAEESKQMSAGVETNTQAQWANDAFACFGKDVLETHPSVTRAWPYTLLSLKICKNAISNAIQFIMKFSVHSTFHHKGRYSGQ